MSAIPPCHSRVDLSVKTSPTILGNARRGESEAWLQLEASYSPLIRFWARQLTRQAIPAEDSAQEVLVEVWRTLDRYKPDGSPSSFRRWLRGITANKVKSHFRTQARRVPTVGSPEAAERLADPEPDSDVENLQEFPSLVDLYDRAFRMIGNQIRSRTLQAAWLSLVEGLSGAEVGQRLGMRPSAVYNARARVVKRLKQLGKSLPESPGSNPRE